MYCTERKYTELVEAIRTDDPMPVISYLEEASAQTVFVSDDIAINIIFNEMISQDKVNLFQIILENGADLLHKFLSAKFESNHSLDTLIAKTIINHEHTEIVCCMLSEQSIRNLAPDLFFEAAVLSENYPVIHILKTIPFIKVNKFALVVNRPPQRIETRIPGKIITKMIEQENYAMLDYLTDNGKNLQNYGICKTLLIESGCEAIKKYLPVLAERYMPDYPRYEDKSEALVDFISSTTDVTDVLNTVFDGSLFSFTSDTEKIIEFLKFISAFGVRLDNVDPIIRYISSTSHYCISNKLLKALIKHTHSFISENACISLSCILWLSKILDKTPKWFLDPLFSEFDSKHTLIVDNINQSDIISYDMFILFQKYFNIRIDGIVKNNKAIERLIERNNLPIMMLLIKEGIFSDDDITEIKELCGKKKKARMLSSIDRWHTEL